MAALYNIPPPAADTVETHINRSIDGLIALLNLRRAQLLTQLRDAREEKRAAAVARQEMQTQLTAARTALQTHLKENPLQSMQERMVSELEEKQRELRMNIPVETEFQCQCYTRDLEASISGIGEIIQVPVGTPNYGTFQIPTVVTGKQGTAHGELNWPRGVTINEATNQIFVVNRSNHRIEIFSETGEYLNQLGDLHGPWGIAIHENSLFVSSLWSHTISKYSLTDFSLVKQVGGRGANNGEFSIPRQLTTDPNGHVYIADSENNRICVLDTDLHHMRNITHQSILKPYDLKLSHDRIYVLCPFKNPCMLVLSIEGDMLHSLISKGQGMDVLRPWFFCLDRDNNFVISDMDTHCIRVFSPAGDLRHTIGREGHQQGMFSQPRGIAITPNGKLVCVSNNENYGLQIYS